MASPARFEVLIGAFLAEILGGIEALSRATTLVLELRPTTLVDARARILRFAAWSRALISRREGAEAKRESLSARGVEGEEVGSAGMRALSRDERVTNLERASEQRATSAAFFFRAHFSENTFALKLIQPIIADF